MKWYNQLAAISLIIMPYVAGIISHKIESNLIERDNFHGYVGRRHLEEIVKNQEKMLGIKHFGIPEISYGTDQNINISGAILCGSYDPKEDRIYLPPELTVCNVKETLGHELGHFYLDKLNESIGKGDFPRDVRYNPEEIGIMLISEGIAEYFGRAISNRKDNFNDSEWPRPEKHWIWRDYPVDRYIGERFRNPRIIYDGGFHFVKPIIEKYGKDGIEYLINNHPRGKDLHNIPEYQRKVMRELSNK